MLEIETIYDDIEDDFDELDNVFLEIEEHNGILSFISNKERDEFNLLIRKEYIFYCIIITTIKKRLAITNTQLF